MTRISKRQVEFGQRQFNTGVLHRSAMSESTKHDVLRRARKYEAAAGARRAEEIRQRACAQRTDYLAHANIADHTRRARREHVSAVQAQRRIERRLKAAFVAQAAFVALAAFYVLVLIFGAIVWMVTLAALALVAAGWFAWTVRRVRVRRARAAREAAETERKRFLAEAPSWAAWADEHDLPASADVWRLIAAEQTAP